MKKKTWYEEYMEEFKTELNKEFKRYIESNPIKEKNSEYGNPVDMFRKVSVIASLITDKDLTPEDCVKVLMAVKLSREAFKHKQDNLVDLKGYTEILELLQRA